MNKIEEVLVLSELIFYDKDKQSEIYNKVARNAIFKMHGTRVENEGAIFLGWSGKVDEIRVKQRGKPSSYLGQEGATCAKALKWGCAWQMGGGESVSGWLELDKQSESEEVKSEQWPEAQGRAFGG